MTNVMPEETINKMMQELGVDNPDFVANKIETESSGTVLEKLIQSGKSLVMTIYQKCLDAMWKAFQSAFRYLIPMLYLRYAIGIWLEEIAKDHGLKRFLGQFTILPLTATKDAGTALTLHAGDVFYIIEQEPRRYEVLEDLEIDQAETEFQFNVQALAPTEEISGDTYIYSARFNAPVGLEWDCEEALPINSVAFNESTYVQSGEDPETDDSLRGRVYALKSLEAIELGIDLYYTQLIKTVAGVAHVTLDSVDDQNATLYYTLYGATGQLTQETLDTAQDRFDSSKMRTDKGVLSLASPLLLELTVSRSGGGTESEIINAVNDHFLAMERGEDFESCFLYNSLEKKWPEATFRISPAYFTLPTGNYFVPDTTIEEIV
ncbi:baseplate J/gp47 family protein [bacterium]|nr:baseplate J/gp47 family protein [bacterium]